ncbi:MAG: carbamoyl-phosphate synthase large subunit [Pseudomonadota bacterium]
MPKRTDLSSILIIGAGPIIIGQACEFDYSGTQACRALKQEGYRIILVNSNPATIMTDPDIADATYVEPITPEIVERIIAEERPDAILPTMGGQTALNTALALEQKGVLEKYNVEMIGARGEVIDRAEDRQKFRETMDEIGLESPKSHAVHSLDEAMIALKDVGLPTIIRPSFTMGGTGGGIAYNKEEFIQIVTQGLNASPTSEVLVEESVLGWKEYEMEVVRDHADNAIIVCSIENLDPMGIHTGDSITVAPALTLSDKEYQMMRNASLAVIRAIGVETGGSNVQFAINPDNGRMVVIEMNPRVSRSSALASKATGFPIAKVAARLAVGYTLDELTNDITKATPASFEPTIDYVVTKMPRFAFEKFPGSHPNLSTAMKSVGEVMAIGRSFAESFQKALRGMEIGLTGLNSPDNMSGLNKGDDINALRAQLAKPTPDRILVVAEAFRYGMSVDDIYAITKHDPWFLEQIKALIDIETQIKSHGLPENRDGWLYIKQQGFSDARLAELTGQSDADIAQIRRSYDVRPVYKRIDTCAAEFMSPTPYMYSTYEHGFIQDQTVCESQISDRNKVAILGGGPNRIGQGIEFDYCCCHACFALKERDIETIMINCNPETVSTDYDTSDRLYFEPLTPEDVIEILTKEQEKGNLLGVIVQFGGQTPLKLASALEEANIPILGTSPDAIDLAEDRERFKALLEETGLRQPANGIARNEAEAILIADEISYPVVIRPSYVLGGRAMEIVYNEEQLKRYMAEAEAALGENPILIDKYLFNATEVDVDALCDGSDVFVCGVMEHIEEAGIHSGDSACSLPPYSLSEEIVQELKRQTVIMAKAIGVCGLINIQFAIQRHEDNNFDVFIIEVNPRASRTVPFVAKVTGQPVTKIAARVMAGEKLGERLSDFALNDKDLDYIAVKEAVFPFSRFPGTDILLGPEMRSTGEVMGIDRTFARAFYKSQLGAGSILPQEGNIFISVRDKDKKAIVTPARQLEKSGFSLIATHGTAHYLREQGIDVKTINKVLEGRPNIVDLMQDGQISMVINTVEGAQSIADSFSIRNTALMMKIPHYTTIAGAKAAAQAMSLKPEEALKVEKIQTYHKGIKAA